MKQEIKKLWVDALRSGKYKQTTTAAFKDRFCNFCVYGVLYDISGIGEWKQEEFSEATYVVKGVFNNGSIPHKSIAEWANFTSVDKRISIDGDIAEIWDHNDRGVTFEKLAKAIEEQL